MEEIRRAPVRKRIKLESIISRVDLDVLEVGSKTLDLADKYIGSGPIPRRYRADAVHIAVSVVNEADAIASWNLSLLKKLKK